MMERNSTVVAFKLREMAHQIETGGFGALRLNHLGEVFGNEFWYLLGYPQEGLDTNRVVTALERIRDAVIQCGRASRQ